MPPRLRNVLLRIPGMVRPHAKLSIGKTNAKNYNWRLLKINLRPPNNTRQARSNRPPEVLRDSMGMAVRPSSKASVNGSGRCLAPASPPIRDRPKSALRFIKNPETDIRDGRFALEAEKRLLRCHPQNPRRRQRQTTSLNEKKHEKTSFWKTPPWAFQSMSKVLF